MSVNIPISFLENLYSKISLLNTKVKKITDNSEFINRKLNNDSKKIVSVLRKQEKLIRLYNNPLIKLNAKGKFDIPKFLVYFENLEKCKKMVEEHISLPTSSMENLKTLEIELKNSEEMRYAMVIVHFQKQISILLYYQVSILAQVHVILYFSENLGEGSYIERKRNKKKCIQNYEKHT